MPNVYSGEGPFLLASSSPGLGLFSRPVTVPDHPQDIQSSLIRCSCSIADQLQVQVRAGGPEIAFHLTSLT
jgi:hypothetical protein